MKISKKGNGTVNPKTGKTYSIDFKKRTVEYYLLGMYEEEQIWKKFQINRTLLGKWRKWYYKHFESPYYSTPNHGKGRIPPSEKQGAEKTAKTRSKYAQKREAKNPWLRATSGHSRSGSQATHKKNGRKGFKS